MKRFAVVLVVLVVAAVWCRSPDKAPALRIATFNIENFPQSSAQVESAFEMLDSLEVDVVALEEILDPVVAVTAARRWLGGSWRGAFCSQCPRQKVGVIYDSDRLELLETREHTELLVYKGARPAFEARFRSSGGEMLRVFVVHLKAGADSSQVREKQLRALRPVIERARRSGDRVTLLGDFNATGDSDRAAISELAAATDMHWASRDLECTCFWQRRESCFGAALDHVLTSRPPLELRVGGACADGCQTGARCPAYRDDISDHCPVVVELR